MCIGIFFFNNSFSLRPSRVRISRALYEYHDFAWYLLEECDAYNIMCVKYSELLNTCYVSSWVFETFSYWKFTYFFVTKVEQNFRQYRILLDCLPWRFSENSFFSEILSKQIICIYYTRWTFFFQGPNVQRPRRRKSLQIIGK